MQILSRIVARESSNVVRVRNAPLEALKAIISIAASHSPEFLTDGMSMFGDRPHLCVENIATGTRQGSEACAGENASRRLLWKEQRKSGLLEKSMYGTRDAASNWERDWQGHLENWGCELGCSSRNLFHNKTRETSGLTHEDDFVVTGTNGSL